jgi:hypothetical protein
MGVRRVSAVGRLSEKRKETEKREEEGKRKQALQNKQRSTPQHCEAARPRSFHAGLRALRCAL